jgi:lysine decarboxylase
VLLGGSRYSGLAIERELIAAGFPLEQADENILIPVVTIADRPSDVAALCDAVIAAAAQAPRTGGGSNPASFAVPGRPPAPLTPREAFFARHETVAVEKAIGRISAELIAPYPPGVPVLVPGETITVETLAALHSARTAGVRIAYAADATLATFQVITRT